GVHRDSRAQVIPTATEVGGVDDTRAGGIQFRDEGVLDTRESRLQGPRGYREVAGQGLARHVGVARSVHCDAKASVEAAAAEEGGVDDSRAGEMQFRDEGVE